MKSAYELAMERLSKSSPTVKLTEKQKAEIAELESVYKAKVAQREIGLKDAINQANEKGEYEEAAKLERQFADERAKLQAELEAKKDRARGGK